MVGTVLKQVAGPRKLVIGHYPRRAKLNKRQTRQVKSIITRGQEKKYWITSQAAVGVDFSGTIWDLTLVPQAAGASSDTTRDGDKITFKSMEFRYTIANSGVNNIMRLIVFQWRSSSIPTAGTVLQSLGSSNAVISSYTHDYHPVVTVLYDKVINLVNVALPIYTGKKMIYGKKVHKQINYVAASTTVGSYKIYLLAVSDDGTATYPQIAFECKLNFTDS